jgi:membrane-associated phospholipid phosphatase
MRIGLLLALWGGLTGVLIALGFGVVHSSTVNAFDRHVTSTVVAHRSSALNATMQALTWLGSWVALVITGAVVLVLAVRGRLAWFAVMLALVVWPGEATGVWLAKHIVQRQRPPKDIWVKSAHGWSWPSGHAATAALVFAVLAMVVTYFFRRRVVLIATWGAAAVAVATVGFSRIELGVHWTTDVLASIVFVSAWLAVSLAFFGREIEGAPGPRTHEGGRHGPTVSGDP